MLETVYLDGNQITNLSAGIYIGLSNLKLLHLRNNLLSTLPKDIFHDLLNIESLTLRGNQITGLSVRIFEGLSNLKELYLPENVLSTLPNGIFQDLLNLERLELNENQMRNLSAGIFVGLSKLKLLYLDNNLLTALPKEIFQALLSLEGLTLYRNQIKILSTDVFVQLRNLRYLSLSNNMLGTLSNEIIQDSTNLVTNLPVDIFKGLQKLKYLSLYNNRLNELHARLFHDLVSLEMLTLYQNRLSNLPFDVFKGLTNLKNLFLFSNQITELHVDTFKGLSNLNYLALENNTLSHLPYNIFKDTASLTFLDLSANRLNEIPNIEHITDLQVLDVSNNTLKKISGTSFTFLPSNLTILVNQHEVCECYVPSHVNCSAADDRSPYLTCDRLLSDRALVVVMWLIGFGALSGNLFVLVWRKKESHINVINSILLGNLAASDLLMGVYMIIIASADIYFGDNFPMQSESWRSGITCRIAGAMSIISSEASVFFVTLISIDRYIAIKFPYSTRRLRKRSVSIVAVVIWTFAFVLGIVPSVLSGYSFKLYDNSHVCIGLPLTLTNVYEIGKNVTTMSFEFGGLTYTRDIEIFTSQYKGLDNGLFFSTTVFFGLNGVCYLIILGCYIEIIRAVMKSSKRSGRSQETKEQIRLTTKVTAIVATDFFCWFPVIILGILVQTRVIILPPSVYAWCVTFVLPINSAINPYLYTIADIISKYRKARQHKRVDANEFKPVITVKSQSPDIFKTESTFKSGISDHQHNQSETDTYL